MDSTSIERLNPSTIWHEGVFAKLVIRFESIRWEHGRLV
jgi:hypothetical protein